jgi:hypothetical protein
MTSIDDYMKIPEFKTHQSTLEHPHTPGDLLINSKYEPLAGLRIILAVGLTAWVGSRIYSGTKDTLKDMGKYIKETFYN